MTNHAGANSKTRKRIDLAQNAYREWMERLAKLPVLPPDVNEAFRQGFELGRAYERGSK